MERPLYHVTALSNFARGYDKYARSYDKARIPESTFEGRFFLLARDELTIGLAKAAHLPQKTGIADDRLITLETIPRRQVLQLTCPASWSRRRRPCSGRGPHLPVWRPLP